MDRNEAIKIVKDYYPVNKPMLSEALEFLIPELKESEDENVDEKVRQALVKLVTNHSSMDLFIEYDIHLDEALSWLNRSVEFPSKIVKGNTYLCVKELKFKERPLGAYAYFKAGSFYKCRRDMWLGDEHNCEEVIDGERLNYFILSEEPKAKFKDGDWVMLDRPVLITKVTDMPYGTHQYWTSEGTWFGDSEKDARLWNIKDAKDGDIIYLPTGDNEYYFFIFKGIENAAVMSFAHFYQYDDGTSEVKGTIDKLSSVNDVFQPATKEQRDLLFQKIHEAGYVWDAEKKKLRKTVTPIFHIGDRIRYKEHKCDGVITEITDTDYICGNTKLPISTQDKLELVE